MTEKDKALIEIHDSIVNGQKKQMVDMIKTYGPDFWKMYMLYLKGYYFDDGEEYRHFSNAVLVFHRLTVSLHRHYEG
jgi:hypothetical protein